MNKTEQAQQLRLAAKILETRHPFEARHKNFTTFDTTDNERPDLWIWKGYEIRLALATPPDGRPLHNPYDLTAEQVGAGHRLALKGEAVDQASDIWMGDKWESLIEPQTVQAATFRLPLSVPWPEAPKPEPAFQLPPPPPRMKWHREDGWKEGHLPQGYRPLVEGEIIQDDDEVRNKDLDGRQFVKAVCSVGYTAGATFPSQHGRTARPLVFTHEGKEWTWRRPGDPMPCDGEALIYVMLEGVPGYNPNSRTAKSCDWGKHNNPMFYQITGWRYAEPETKTVPLGPEDVPPGSVFRMNHFDSGVWILPCATASNGISYANPDRECEELTWSQLNGDFQINRSIPLTGKWDPTAWEPCHKTLANG